MPDREIEETLPQIHTPWVYSVRMPIIPIRLLLPLSALPAMKSELVQCRCGGPVKYTLTDHNTWDQQPMQMIYDTLRSAYSHRVFILNKITTSKPMNWYSSR
jgi:hypothetical protein